jgi:tRNA(Ile)-lysidine synthase
MQLENDGHDDDERLLQSVGAAFRACSPDQRKIGLAVSGGSDSMAMLHLFARLAEAQGFELSAATVDHGLRDEAVEEAQLVAKTCEGLGISHQILKWKDWDGTGNLQANARDARYRLLADWALTLGLEVVLIGHTQNDQAETFLARLARGSGLDGLAGMVPKFMRNDVDFARPCLSLERDTLRQYLTRHGHEWCDDPSNEDERFQRVVTRKILSALEPLGIDATSIARTTSELSMAKSGLQHIVQKCAEDIIRFDVGDIVISWDKFSQTHSEVQRRLLVEALKWIGQTDYAPRSDAVQDLLRGMVLNKTRTLNGCIVTVTKNELRICREFHSVESMACATDHHWDMRWQLDGPHDSGLKIRALGPIGLPQCPDWRATGLPRSSLLASPAIWRGDELTAAPLANFNPEWTATLLRGAKQFYSSIVPH